MANKSKRRNKEPSENYSPDLDEEVEQPRIKYRMVLMYLIDQDEVNELIAASTAEFVESIQPVEVIHQHSYSLEEANQLINGEPISTRKLKKKK